MYDYEACVCVRVRTCVCVYMCVYACVFLSDVLWMKHERTVAVCSDSEWPEGLGVVIHSGKGRKTESCVDQSYTTRSQKSVGQH